MIKALLDKVLIDDWQACHKLWSVRLLVLGAIIDGLYMALPAFTSMIEPFHFLALSLVLSLATLAARIVNQKGP